jgi:hypothetical protein
MVALFHKQSHRWKKQESEGELMVQKEVTEARM